MRFIELTDMKVEIEIVDVVWNIGGKWIEI